MAALREAGGLRERGAVPPVEDRGKPDVSSCSLTRGPYTLRHPPAPVPAPETGVNIAGGEGMGAGRPTSQPRGTATDQRPVGRKDRGRGLPVLAGAGLSSDWRWHAGRLACRACQKVRARWGRPGRQGGGAHARPRLQPFPALIVLGENRTPSRSHCLAPPALLPWGLGKDVGKQERARDS